MTERGPAAARPAPIAFIVLSLVAALFLAAGVTGLFLPEVAPRLARPAVAWSLIGVGVVLDGFAVAALFSARARARL